MQSAKCPKCGHETAADSACPACGQAAVNGAARPARRDPPPPPEVAGWNIERPTPEMLEEARRTFDEAEYLAAVREIERTGGVQIDDLIASWSGEYMTAPEPPSPYQVVYSEAVKQRLRELSDIAIARGDGPAFLAALKAFVERLPVYPQLGDPLSDLEVGGGQFRLGIIRPISMRYGVNEDLRIVFCGTLPVLLPMARPEEEASE